MPVSPPPGRPSGRPASAAVGRWRSSPCDVVHDFAGRCLPGKSDDQVQLMAKPRPASSTGKYVAAVPCQANALAKQPSRATGSAAMVVECLEVALLKLQSQPAWRMAGSGFLERTLTSVADASCAQIQANRAKSIELVKQVEDWQAQLKSSEAKLQLTRTTWAAQQARFCEAAEVSKTALQGALDRQVTEKKLLEETRAQQQQLESTAGEALREKRKAQSEQRSAILSKREAVASQLEAARAEHAREQQELDELLAESGRVKKAIQVSEVEVEEMPEMEERLANLKEKRQEVHLQHRELQQEKEKKHRKSLGAS
eukprot:TRINITY_DN36274_c0_g1_i2.p1 TRINITY_DN36274_c0_g1~~TRINITY_DN36274_c0_g1_i2.p1  ORF type:complete len:314 (-),score=80.30 TRINITY_DN36274_c0_g1_i2:23-964(-)